MEEENVQRLETVKQTVEGEEYEDPAASEEDVHEEQIISESQPQAIEISELNLEEQQVVHEQVVHQTEPAQIIHTNESIFTGQKPFREQDIFLPIANVARIMKNAIPANGKIAKEAKECVQECVSEFISFITSEAAERCQQEKRKTINGEDILFALTTLGFEPYVEPLKIYLGKYRDSIKGDKMEDAQEEISINTPQIVQIAGESGVTQHVIIQENGQMIQTADGHQLVFKTD
ncbi:Oidioi.mRNA.OKI2018_I69.PAR.g11187.t1.cds [Oikopleura dioica]|uniref:Oidioi.mRNA.OKI2018_I69.PAR.g11187.t1.cds n=1 Tax=Oikopleura dioica TaxID=34765 RepID=A0ABN7RUY2_OIKDI|nr:Oidioi.mRNA.OKI2018_I69.PAR.g11187.t1.cds [Oikopleura dioica]